MAARTSLEEILRRNRERALALSGSVGKEKVAKLLAAAQKDLAKRLGQAEGLKGAGAGSFTATQLRMTMKQVEDVLRTVKPELAGIVVGQSKTAAETAGADTLAYMGEAEKTYRGIAQPLALNEAAVLDQARQGTESSVLRRILSDPTHKGHVGVLDRYGESVIGHFEEQLQLRFLARKPWDEVRQSLIEGSDWLQKSPLYWAERIVRTETMAAHGRASWETIRAADDELGDMVKILCATFDDRTAADSFAVHGQIRRPDEAFQSWFGLYQSPPNRPNDREVVVPHRISWPIPPSLQMKTDAEVAARWALEVAQKKHGKAAMPPRPKMTTVPLDKFGVTPPAAPQAPGAPETQIAPGAPPAAQEAPETRVGPQARGAAVYPSDTRYAPGARAIDPEQAPAFAPPVPAPPIPLPPGFVEPVAPTPFAPPEAFAPSAVDKALAALEKLPSEGPNVAHGFKSVAPGKVPYKATPELEAKFWEKIGKLWEDLDAGKKVPAKSFKFDQIHAIGTGVPKYLVEKAAKAEAETAKPVIVKYGGKAYLYGGADHLLALKLKGQKSATCNFIELDEPKTAKTPAPVPAPTVSPPSAASTSSQPLKASEVRGAIANLQHSGYPHDASPPAGYREKLDASFAKAKVSSAELDGLHKFSFGYDWTIRELDKGRSPADVVEDVLAFRQSRGWTRKMAEDHVAEAEKAWRDLYKMLDRVEPSMPGRIVYRGIGKLDAATMQTFLENDEIEFDAVSSTSHKASASRSFMATTADKPFSLLFEIRQQTGVGIEHCSQFPGERELLMKGGTRYRVTGRRRLSPTSIVLEMEEIVEGGSSSSAASSRKKGSP